MDYLENDLLEDLENGVEDIGAEDDDFDNEDWGEDDDFDNEDWGEDDDDDDDESAGEFLWNRRRRGFKAKRARRPRKLKRGRKLYRPRGRSLRAQLKKLHIQLKSVDKNSKANAVRLRGSIKVNSKDIAKVRTSNVVQNRKLNKINKAVENLNAQRMWTMLMPPSIKSYTPVDSKGENPGDEVFVSKVKTDMNNSLMMMMMSGGMNIGGGKSGGMDPMMMMLMMNKDNGGLFGSGDGDNSMMLMMMMMMNKK